MPILQATQRHEPSFSGFARAIRAALSLKTQVIDGECELR